MTWTLLGEALAGALRALANDVEREAAVASRRLERKGPGAQGESTHRPSAPEGGAAGGSEIEVATRKRRAFPTESVPAPALRCRVVMGEVHSTLANSPCSRSAAAV